MEWMLSEGHLNAWLSVANIESLNGQFCLFSVKIHTDTEDAPTASVATGSSSPDGSQSAVLSTEPTAGAADGQPPGRPGGPRPENAAGSSAGSTAADTGTVPKLWVHSFFPDKFLFPFLQVTSINLYSMWCIFASILLCNANKWK